MSNNKLTAPTPREQAVLDILGWEWEVEDSDNSALVAPVGIQGKQEIAL